jgi:hypothetical protein
MGGSGFVAAIGGLVRSLSAIADGAGALPRLGVYVLLLLRKNEDRSTLLRGQSKILESGGFGSGVLGSLSLFATVVVFGLVVVESFVVVDPYGFLRGVGPSQLDRASLQAAGMVAEDLRVRPYLAVPKRDHRFVVRVSVMRRRRGRGRARGHFSEGFLTGGGFRFGIVILSIIIGRHRSQGTRGRLSFQRRPGEDVEIVMLVMISVAVVGMMLFVVVFVRRAIAAIGASVGKVELQQEAVDVR